MGVSGQTPRVNLVRDRSIKIRIAAQIHGTHAALAKSLDDFVLSDSTGGQTQ